MDRTDNRSVALVAGCTGVAGNALVSTLVSDYELEFQKVICLSSSKLDINSLLPVTHSSLSSVSVLSISCDLNNRHELVSQLELIGCPPITHIFWFADVNSAPKLLPASFENKA